MESQSASVQPTSVTDPSQDGFKAKAGREIVHFLIIFAYVWMMVLLFQIHRFVILAENQIPIDSFGLGLINALVVAKVILIGDRFRLSA
jgi:hypothetical protein